MGYVEFFRLNKNGAGWVDLSKATQEELFDISFALEVEGSPVTPLENQVAKEA